MVRDVVDPERFLIYIQFEYLFFFVLLLPIPPCPCVIGIQKLVVRNEVFHVYVFASTCCPIPA